MPSDCFAACGECDACMLQALIEALVVSDPTFDFVVIPDGTMVVRIAQDASAAN